MPTTTIENTEFAYRDIDHFFRKRHFITNGGTERTVSAVFHDRATLDQAVLALREADFRNDDIFLTTSHNGSVLDNSLRIVSIAPFLVPFSILAGMIVGGLMGWLSQLGNLPFFGIQPFMFSSALDSMAASGSVGAFVGGMLGTIFGMRIPEYQPHKYETSYPAGTLFLVVRTCDEEETRLANQTIAPFLEEDTFTQTREEIAA